MSRMRPLEVASDPNADYGRLWLAVHNYLIVAGGEQQNTTELANAYDELVEAHNLIHARYVQEPGPARIAGT